MFLDTWQNGNPLEVRQFTLSNSKARESLKQHHLIIRSCCCVELIKFILEVQLLHDTLMSWYWNSLTNFNTRCNDDFFASTFWSSSVTMTSIWGNVLVNKQEVVWFIISVQSFVLNMKDGRIKRISFREILFTITSKYKISEKRTWESLTGKSWIKELQ